MRTLVAIGGLAGAGKSTVSKELAASSIAPCIVVISTDSVRKELARVPLTAKLPDRFYTTENRDAVYAETRRRTIAALKNNSFIIWDASFGREKDRRIAEQVAEQTGSRFLGVVLQAPLAIRIRNVEARALNPSDADRDYILSGECTDYPTNCDILWTALQNAGESSEAIAKILLRLR